MPLEGYKTTSFAYEAERKHHSHLETADTVFRWLWGLRRDDRLFGVFGPTYGEAAYRVLDSLINQRVFFQVTSPFTTSTVAATLVPVPVLTPEIQLPVEKVAVVFQVQSGNAVSTLNRMGLKPLLATFHFDRRLSPENGRIFPYQVNESPIFRVFPTHDLPQTRKITL